MTLLVTGGAGYIGSQTAQLALDAGREVVIVDDLSTGDRAAAPMGAVFHEAGVADSAAMKSLIRRYGVTEIIHFAASAIAPESVQAPLRYYANNVAAVIALLEACRNSGVARFVFSSTAAVYGDASGAVAENARSAPISPYGRSKLMAETILRDVAEATGMRATSLRYFNVAGADPAGRTGQRGQAATHLFKVACEVAAGARARLTIHGDDWPTPDGTGLRDYVHVHDLARAHLLALERGGGTVEVINLGCGTGYSVREVIAAVSEARGAALDVEIGPRRWGDVAQVIADIGRAETILGWKPRFSLQDMAVHALAWERTMGARRAAETRKALANAL